MVISDVRIDVGDPRIAARYELVPGLEGMYVRHDPAAAMPPAPGGVSAPPARDGGS